MSLSTSSSDASHPRTARVPSGRNLAARGIGGGPDRLDDLAYPGALEVGEELIERVVLIEQPVRHAAAVRIHGKHCAHAERVTIADARAIVDLPFQEPISTTLTGPGSGWLATARCSVHASSSPSQPRRPEAPRSVDSAAS